MVRSMPDATTGSLVALRVREFRILWFGTIFSFMAFFMSMIVQSVVAFEISGNNSSVGLIVAAQGVAMILLGPIGGRLCGPFAEAQRRNRWPDPGGLRFVLDGRHDHDRSDFHSLVGRERSAGWRGGGFCGPLASRHGSGSSSGGDPGQCHGGKQSRQYIFKSTGSGCWRGLYWCGSTRGQWVPMW